MEAQEVIFTLLHFFQCKNILSVVLHCAVILYHIFLLFKMMVPEKLSFITALLIVAIKQEMLFFPLLNSISFLCQFLNC